MDGDTLYESDVTAFSCRLLMSFRRYSCGDAAAYLVSYLYCIARKDTSWRFAAFLARSEREPRSWVQQRQDYL